jgi:hemerythrin-like metal-binding protein
MKEGASRDQIKSMVVFLDNYTAGHFEREEAYMKEVACPSLVENCKAHAALREKLGKWKEQLNQGASTALVIDIHKETSAWIMGHIIKVDCKLRGCQVPA